MTKRWFFEPGHTAAELSVRHMMVTNVRGHFKNVHGTFVTIMCRTLNSAAV